MKIEEINYHTPHHSLSCVADGPGQEAERHAGVQHMHKIEECGVTSRRVPSGIKAATQNLTIWSNSAINPERNSHRDHCGGRWE